MVLQVFSYRLLEYQNYFIFRYVIGIRGFQIEDGMKWDILYRLLEGYLLFIRKDFFKEKVWYVGQ